MLGAAAEDAAGFTVLPPTLPSRRTDVRFVRDLHARDSLLLRDYKGAVYLLKPSSPAVGAVPQFYPVRIDSLWATWRGARTRRSHSRGRDRAHGTAEWQPQRRHGTGLQTGQVEEGFVDGAGRNRCRTWRYGSQ